MAGLVEEVRSEAQSLADIHTEPGLESSLKRWDETLKLTLTTIESIRARAQAAKNEMYLLISFYLVFQGGVMNALASKANAKKCEYAVFPSLLSTLAFGAALASVHDKFHEYHEMKKKREMNEEVSRKLQQKIFMLLRNGKAFISEDGGCKTKPATEADTVTSTDQLAGAGTATSTDQLAEVPPQPVHEWREMWIVNQRGYLDVMIFLSVVFVIVFVNCFIVC